MPDLAAFVAACPTFDRRLIHATRARCALAHIAQLRLIGSFLKERYALRAPKP
jgi:hypothetical protein